MGLLIEHGVAADDTGDTTHRPNVYLTDVPRDDSVAPERERIVVRFTERTALYLGQSASNDMGLRIEHGVAPDAAKDA